jgi:predicted nuclease with TOPRIM domain
MSNPEKQQQIEEVQERLRQVVRKLRRAPMNESYTDEYEKLQRKLDNLRKSTT